MADKVKTRQFLRLLQQQSFAALFAESVEEEPFKMVRDAGFEPATPTVSR